MGKHDGNMAEARQVRDITNTELDYVCVYTDLMFSFAAIFRLSSECVSTYVDYICPILLVLYTPIFPPFVFNTLII